MRFSIGVDLGQANDYTAISIIERQASKLAVRHLERFRDIPYPRVIDRLSELKVSLPHAGLVVDQTGVGRPVVDQMIERELEPTPVTITSGTQIRETKEGFKVPKVLLMKPLMLALEQGSLSIAGSLPLAPLLKDELQRFQTNFGQRGHVKMEAATGHDDLVLSVALSMLEI